MNIYRRPLWPSLEIIETDLFVPSDTLIARWAANDPRLSRAVIKTLEADPAARDRRNRMRQPETLQEDSDQAPVPPMPETLRESIERRLAACTAHFSPFPKAGQIIAIEQIVGPDGLLGVDLPRPLTILLAEPTETPRVWYGWLVSPETDYASWWDLLLEPEDEPFDPLAGMVQVWNSVHVYLPGAAQVLAELSPARLQAVWSLAIDFLAAIDPGSDIPAPGRIIPRRTQGGAPVLTGTPLGDNGDPRLHYQKLYNAAAGMLREAVKLALSRTATTRETTLYLDRILDFLTAAIRQVGMIVTPTEAVEHAMGTAQREDRHYALDNWLTLRINILEEDQSTVLNLRCSLRGADAAIVRLFQGGDILQEHELTTENPQAELLLDPVLPHVLVLEGRPGGRYVQARIPLPEIFTPPRP